MRVDQISRALAAALRQTSGRMSLFAGSASQLGAETNLKTIRELELRLRAAVRPEAGVVHPELTSDWEQELNSPAAAHHSAPRSEIRAFLRDQLISQNAIQAARSWDSEYAPENRAERHPDNRFLEGMTASGQPDYLPADYVARTFTPSAEDERLALLIVQHAKSALPGGLREFEREEGTQDRTAELLPWIARGFAIAIVFTCVALILSV